MFLVFVRKVTYEFFLTGKDKDEMPLAVSEAKSQEGEKPSLLSKIKTALFG